MVRRKIEIKLIEEKSKRHTTFTKRRKGLMKKTEEFAKKTDSTAAVIAFSNAGNCYVLGHPDVHTVLNRYAAESMSASSSAFPALGVEEEEAALAAEVERRIGAGVDKGRWDVAVKGLGLEELGELKAEVENIRRKLVARAMKIAGVEETSTGSSGSD